MCFYHFECRDYAAFLMPVNAVVAADAVAVGWALARRLPAGQSLSFEQSLLFQGFKRKSCGFVGKRLYAGQYRASRPCLFCKTKPHDEDSFVRLFSDFPQDGMGFLLPGGQRRLCSPAFHAIRGQPASVRLRLILFEVTADFFDVTGFGQSQLQEDARFLRVERARNHVAGFVHVDIRRYRA